jgi:neural cell adhesion molecule
MNYDFSSAGQSAAMEHNSLEILPNGKIQTKPVGSSILMTCKPQVADTNLISNIQWIDPQNNSIESLK